MNNFNQDWKHVDTSPKMNKYEQVYYGFVFCVVFVALALLFPAVLMGLL